MVHRSPHVGADRILVVMPAWLGDVVMATPTLRALRRIHSDAVITALIRRPLKPILESCPWVNRLVTVRSGHREKMPKGHSRVFTLARRLRAGRFHTAIILPNSFRSALLTRLARIPRRVGYDRDGRGFLLTDRLVARREGGRFVPVPTRDYYLAMARYLGAMDPDPAMELFTRQEDEAAASRMLQRAGVATGQHLVVITPGANYGDAKMWHPDRFAAVSDRCIRQLGAVVAVAGAQKERPILDAVIGAASEPILDLSALGMGLGLLKSVIRRSSLLITNDTGPRHVAAAFGTPVVSVFGPTDPAWTEIGFDKERRVMVKVFCGPCQKKRCPIDHRCMTLIGPDMVFKKVVQLLNRNRPSNVPV